MLGFDVTVFEKKEMAGGLSTYGIVVFREPVEVSLAEVKMVEEMGVTVKTGVTIGKDGKLDPAAFRVADADRKAIPDPEVYEQCLSSAVEELLDAARAHQR